MTRRRLRRLLVPLLEQLDHARLARVARTLGGEGLLDAAEPFVLERDLELEQAVRLVRHLQLLHPSEQLLRRALHLALRAAKRISELRLLECQHPLRRASGEKFVGSAAQLALTERALGLRLRRHIGTQLERLGTLRLELSVEERDALLHAVARTLLRLDLLARTGERRLLHLELVVAEGLELRASLRELELRRLGLFLELEESSVLEGRALLGTLDEDGAQPLRLLQLSHLLITSVEVGLHCEELGVESDELLVT